MEAGAGAAGAADGAEAGAGDAATAAYVKPAVLVGSGIGPWGRMDPGVVETAAAEAAVAVVRRRLQGAAHEPTFCSKWWSQACSSL